MTAQTSIRVALDSREAQQGLQRLQGIGRKAAAGIGAGMKVAVAGVGAIAGAAAGATAAFKAFADNIDATAKTARRLNIGIEALQGLRFAAEDAGISTSALESGLQKMQKRAVDAANGTGAAARAYQRLGISAQTVAQQSPERAIETLGAALKDVQNPAEQTRLAMQLFGDQAGPKMRDLLSQGAEGLQGARAEAKQLGIVVSEETAVSVENFQASLLRSQSVFKGFGTQLMSSFAPAFEVVSENVFAFLKQLGGVPRIAKVVSGAVLRIIEVSLNLGKAFEIIPAAVMAAFAGVKLTIADAINAVMAQVEKLFGFLPDRVRDWIGARDNALQIDTSALRQEAVRAGETLAAVLSSKGVGTQLIEQIEAQMAENLEEAEVRRVRRRRTRRRASAAPTSSPSGAAAAATATRSRAPRATGPEPAEQSAPAETAEEQMGMLRETLAGQGEKLLSDISAVKQQGLGLFQEFGGGISAAFSTALQGGDFGKALEQAVGQILTTMGTQLIQTGIMALLTAPLASIPFFGGLFGPPGKLFAVGAALTAGGAAMTALGSSMGGSGGGGGASAGARSSGGGASRSSTRPRRSRGPQFGPDFGGGMGSQPQVVNVTFNAPVDRRGVRRELQDILGGGR